MARMRNEIYGDLLDRKKRALELHRPVFLIVAGPNGAGKTTLCESPRFLHRMGDWLDTGHFLNPDKISLVERALDPRLSAECGLKHLMSRFGMQVYPNTGSPADKKNRIHADALWSRFEAYLSGHPQATGYVLGLPNPFSDWEISQRFFPRHYFNTSRTRAHKEGADEVRRLVGKALHEGLI